MANESVGKADIKIGGTTYKDLPVYAYHDPETNTNYRSIFLSELPDTREPGMMPEMATVKYRGNSYKAKKFSNPNNNIPTYDFTVDNKV